MKLEKNSKAVDYIGELIERYNKDSTIFSKALQIFNTYKLQSSWPHNFQILNKSLSLLFGINHEDVLNFIENYVQLKRNRQLKIDFNDIEWPDNIKQGFVTELEIYYELVKQDLNQASIARIKPLKFSGLVRSQVPMSRTKILKLIRMDGKALEFEVDRNDVNAIIRTLEIMVQDSCEINDEV